MICVYVCIHSTWFTWCTTWEEILFGVLAFTCGKQNEKPNATDKVLKWNERRKTKETKPISSVCRSKYDIFIARWHRTIATACIWFVLSFILSFFLPFFFYNKFVCMQCGIQLCSVCTYVFLMDAMKRHWNKMDSERKSMFFMVFWNIKMSQNEKHLRDSAHGRVQVAYDHIIKSLPSICGINALDRLILTWMRK